MPSTNAMKEHAKQRLVTGFIAHIGPYMAPLGKAGVLHIRPTTKPRNMALAGCSECRMRRIQLLSVADESNQPAIYPVSPRWASRVDAQPSTARPQVNCCRHRMVSSMRGSLGCDSFSTGTLASPVVRLILIAMTNWELSE